MIEVRQLTKTFRGRTAVDRLTFTVRPGRVTGFLGPNGAGKSTTMRMILGLDRPDGGTATVDGRPYAALPRPAHAVGALLDGRALHPGRSARQHLRAMAAATGVPRTRVEQVLGDVGLDEVAHRRAGEFSLGMLQRLGVAGALLADPGILVLDEPVNGLDPDGVRWIRCLLRRLADEGRTVFLSSHLMSEVQLTADHLVVVGRGALLADVSLDAMLATSRRRTLARTPDRVRLREAIGRTGATTTIDADGRVVTDAPPGTVGDLAAESGIRLHELRADAPSLEDAYRALTDHHAAHPTAPDPADIASVR